MFLPVYLCNPPNLWYNTRMIQQQCEACGQVLTLSRPPPEVQYCYDCTKEFDTMLAAPKLTDAELDDWAKKCGAEQWDVYQYDN